MTKTQKNVIASPATGLLVYQTGPDSIGFHYYTGSGWLWLEPVSTNAWKTTGNGSVTMQYSAADSRWMVIAVRD